MTPPARGAKKKRPLGSPLEGNQHKRGGLVLHKKSFGRHTLPGGEETCKKKAKTKSYSSKKTLDIRAGGEDLIVGEEEAV